MKMYVLVVLGCVVFANAAKLDTKCGKCDKDACPAVSCLADKTKDACNCCDVCLKMEGEECDPSIQPKGYGDCGTGLACMKVGNEHYCLCETEEIVCGDDEVTYNNICQMNAANARAGTKVEKKDAGPCNPAAKIVSAPEYSTNHTGGSVVLSCEAVGNPVPYIAWLFTRVDGKSFPMPGDDQKVLTAARGGPARYQVTGWLQIKDLAKKHEGDYTCVAKNGDKKVHAKARVKVTNPGEL